VKIDSILKRHKRVSPTPEQASPPIPRARPGDGRHDQLGNFQTALLAAAPITQNAADHQAARALDGNRRSLSPEWRAEAIGRLQRVTKAEWQQLDMRAIALADMPRRNARRKGSCVTDSTNAEAPGPRQEASIRVFNSKSRTKPWEAEGISRRGHTCATTTRRVQEPEISSLRLPTRRPSCRG
jgi:hypothetical protein